MLQTQSFVLCNFIPVGLPSKNIFEIIFLIVFASIMTVEDLEKHDVYLIILVIERELLVYTRRMGAMHFIFKVKQKKT